MLRFLKIKIKIRRSFFFFLIFSDIAFKVAMLICGVLQWKMLFYDQTYFSLGRFWYAFFLVDSFPNFIEFWGSSSRLEMIHSPSLNKASL